jgi:hypothetical protein
MPGNDIGIEIRGGKQLERIIKALREVGDGGLARELKSGLRKAARPMVPKVRQAIDRIPSNHDGQLRAEMKSATTVTFRSAGTQAGITLRVDGRKMPSGKRSLPAYMEGTKPSWRHPVYGNTDVWAQQPSHSFFRPVVAELGGDIHRDMNAVAQAIAKRLT